MRRALIAAAAAAALAVPLSGCDALGAIFPSHHHDRVPPELPDEIARPAVLVFSKTNGYRHGDAIAAGVTAFETLARRNGWGLLATENGAVHRPELLARFDVVVWLQVSGDVLDPAQRAALRRYLEDGGAFLGIHGTGGDPDYDWAWQPDTLVAAQFVGHPMNPQLQRATVRLEAPEHPVLRGLPPAWERVDEWYSFAESPRAKGVEVLASLDESTYRPVIDWWLTERDLRMGDDHPIVWTHCIGRGRSVYSALGHPPEAWAEPLHLRLLGSAVAWLADPATGTCP